MRRNPHSETSSETRARGTSPEAVSVEQWAFLYITTTHLEHKKSPPSPPKAWNPTPRLPAPPAPGRPPELRQRNTRSQRSSKSLSTPLQRARLLHRFWHHELQAAELMCWALLRFADTPIDFRRGLLRICLDEIRHMSLYEGRLKCLGYPLGSFPVRDWFWSRVPSCQTPQSFTALMGLGLESANLDHSLRFVEAFETGGDLDSAEVQRRVCADEESHVRFAVEWFSRLGGELDFEAWRSCLPPPLSPLLMRGLPLNDAARQRAGQHPRFLEALREWRPESGS